MGSTINTGVASSFYVNPIRNAPTVSNVLTYNTGTSEVGYTPMSSYLTVTTSSLLLTPTQNGIISTTISTGLGYTAGSLVNFTSISYYIDILSTSNITFSQNVTVIGAFIIGGGGGGGAAHGGGGGAGAYLFSTGMSITGVSALNIVIGAGGVGAPASGGVDAHGRFGGSTFISTTTVAGVWNGFAVPGGGGGGGNGTNSTIGFAGGCGGGGGSYDQSAGPSITAVRAGGATTAVFPIIGNTGGAGYDCGSHGQSAWTVQFGAVRSQRNQIRSKNARSRIHSC